MKTTFPILIGIFLLSGTLLAQPCMPAWRYRTPITLDNSSNPNPLVDYQVKLTMATDALIAAGEMKADGGDIRLTNAAGVQLPHWIVNNSLNTGATEIWVNVDNIPPGSLIDIFLFYGNDQAASTMSGDATFLHYDNFDGTALDFGKWTFCGPIIPVVSNGEVTFNSSSGINDHMIRSVQRFSGPITTEMKVNAGNNGIGMVGQITASDDGYAMAFENAASVDAMRLVSLEPGVSPACLDLVNQSPINSVSAGPLTGLWSFSWSEAAEQLFSWPGGSETRTDNLEALGFPDAKAAVIGSFTNTGSISVDYTYTRKYSPIVPGFAFGPRIELIDTVVAGTNAPVCVGDTLRLFAPSFAGAMYSWVGPNGYTSTDQNPVIPISNFGHVGKFVVTVSAPTGCTPVLDSVDVELDSVPVAGTLLSDVTLCKGMNNGQLQLTGTTGNILYWESAFSQGGPWSTITNTTDTLDYLNIQSTRYFRSVVEFGSCGMDTSNTVTLTIDELSDGGHVIGTANACYGFNTGTLSVISYVGDVLKWEYSSDQGANWTDISTTSNQISYNNLTDTTWYRVEVQNGVCGSVYSDTAVIWIQPLPVVDFSAISACHGHVTDFTNLSSIPHGTLDTYTWDFGDGTGSTNENPSHTFANPGTHSILLEAISDQGCVDSLRDDITVLPSPTVDFSFSDVCENSAASFTNTSTVSPGTIVANYWNYGDGQAPDTSTHASHLYTGHGSFDVTLISVTDSGCTDSTQQAVRILRRAVVDLAVDSVCLNEAIAFDNLTSTLEDSTVYSWNFGNGDFSSQREPVYTYPAYGTFEVVLQATTFGMCIDTKTDTVVIHPLPDTDFTFENVCRYDPAEFDNLSSIPFGTVTYNWSFGDSTTGVGDSISHFYNLPGNYFVNLLATSGEGCVDDTTLGVEIFPVPDANFVLSDVCRDTVAAITNTSTISAGTIGYLWDLGDGSVSSNTDPNYTYPTDGDYTIQLLATSNEGCLDSISKDITIFSIPVANFEFDPVCFGIPTEFENTTTINTGFVASYQWNLGNGSFSFDRDVIHLYASAGAYDVNLFATSNAGCVHDTTITITVNPFPEVDFEFVDDCAGNPVQFRNLSQIDFGTMTYEWEFGNDSVSQQSSPIETYIFHGFFPVQLTASSEEGCIDSLTKVIEIYPLPLLDAGPDTSVSFGFSTRLEGISPAAVNVDWSPGLTVADNGALVTDARPLESTTYTLSVTDQFGCQNSDELTVEVINDYKLLISNVLTPNGDGRNDTWQILNADAFEVLHIRVYDRWGKTVYEADNYTNAWDGNVNLDALPEGTYFYLITFDETDEVYKGAVSILREQN